MATAAPTDPLRNAGLFAAQVNELINKNLSEDGSTVIFDHFSQLCGYVLLAKALFTAHGAEHDIASFKRVVEHVWKQDGLISVQAKP